MSKPDMTVDEKFELTIQRALEYDREHGIPIGASVIHPKRRISYILDRVEGDQAFVSHPAGKSQFGDKDWPAEQACFPLAEIFSEATLAQVVTEIKLASHSARLPSYEFIEIILD